MAKDPAMLWYWGDWNSGTSTMSRFLKGCYMDLLHAQFNTGRLSLEEIRTVLGSDFGQSWPTLQKKFAVDQTGKYFNERLELEKGKRAAYTASRRKNLESLHMDSHMQQHMTPHMENVNEDRNVIVIESKGVQGEIFSDEWFRSIFDDIHVSNVKSIFPHHNVDNELKIFKLKVRGSPDDYRHRDIGGIRNALNYQLQKSTATNEHRNTPKGTPQPTTAIIESDKSFGLEKGFSRSGADRRRN